MKKDYIDWILLEDERHTAKELVRLVTISRETYRNIAIIDTWRKFKEFWKCHSESDLIIADESLADGSIFNSLSEMEIHTPMIVVTSNDRHSKDDFPTRVVDILLHPVCIEEMSAALHSFEKTH